MIEVIGLCNALAVWLLFKSNPPLSKRPPREGLEKFFGVSAGLSDFGAKFTEIFPEVLS